MGCNCSEPKQDKQLEQAAYKSNTTKSNSSKSLLNNNDDKKSHTESYSNSDSKLLNGHTPKGNLTVYKNGTKQNTEKRIINNSRFKQDQTIREVLENDMLKEKALGLCKENEELSSEGEDSGFITFTQKYLKQNVVDQLYIKCGITDDEITDLTELSLMLAMCIILYKAQVTKIKNMVFDGVNVNKTRFQKSEVKPVAKYISCWIINRYGNNGMNGRYGSLEGDDDDEFYIAREKYTEQMSQYLRDFVRFEWRSFRSMMSVDISLNKSGDQDNMESLNEE